MSFPYATAIEHAAVLVHPIYVAAGPKALRAYQITRDREMRKAERMERRARERFAAELKDAAEALLLADAKGLAARTNIERAAYTKALAAIRRLS